MKKLFLLSVLFIFMGNVLAGMPTNVSKSGMIETIIDNDFIDLEGKLNLNVVCIADYVFVQINNGTLTQLFEREVLNGYHSVPMTCKEYKRRMRKWQG